MQAHPYRQAFEAQDVDRALSLLSDDVIFHSGMTTDPPFEGRDAVAAIVAISFEVFKDIEFTHELGDERTLVLIGHTQVLDEPIKTTWLLELDDEGKVREMWIMARPLAGYVAAILAIAQAAERAGAGSEMRELTEPLPDPIAELQRAASRVIADLNRSTASRSAA